MTKTKTKKLRDAMKAAALPKKKAAVKAAIKKIAASTVLVGRGDYSTRGAELGRAVGSVADGVSNSVRAFRRLFGGGSYNDVNIRQMKNAVPYTPKKNSLFHAESFDHPIMELNGQQYAFEGPRPRIIHRELIGSVMTPNSGVVFATQSFLLNPGLASTFPWLNSVARNFQAYQLNGFMIHFESTSSEYVSSAALGDVTISSQYDVNRPPFDNDVEVKNSAYATYAKPSCSFLHPVECAKKMSLTQKHMIRTDSDPVTTTDELLYDFCRIQVSTNGVQTPATAVKLGNIYAVYDITLEQPNVHPTPAPSTMALISRKIDPANISGGTNYSPIGRDPAVSNGWWRMVDGIGLKPVSGGGGLQASWAADTFGFAIPPLHNGYYLLLKVCRASAMGTVNRFAGLGTGVTRIPYWTGIPNAASSSANIFPAVGQSESKGSNMNPGPGDTVYDSFGTAIAGPAGASVFATLLNFQGTKTEDNFLVLTGDATQAVVYTTPVSWDTFVIRLNTALYSQPTVSDIQQQVDEAVFRALSSMGLSSTDSSSSVAPLKLVSEEKEEGLCDSPYAEVHEPLPLRVRLQQQSEETVRNRQFVSRSSGAGQ